MSDTKHILPGNAGEVRSENHNRDGVPSNYPSCCGRETADKVIPRAPMAEDSVQHTRFGKRSPYRRGADAEAKQRKHRVSHG